MEKFESKIGDNANEAVITVIKEPRNDYATIEFYSKESNYPFKGKFYKNGVEQLHDILSKVIEIFEEESKIRIFESERRSLYLKDKEMYYREGGTTFIFYKEKVRFLIDFINRANSFSETGNVFTASIELLGYSMDSLTPTRVEFKFESGVVRVNNSFSVNAKDFLALTSFIEDV